LGFRVQVLKTVEVSKWFIGIAYNIDEDSIGAILLGEDSLLNAGDEVERTGRVMDIPVDNALIGRVINPLGEPVDGKGSFSFKQRCLLSDLLLL